MEGVQLIGKSKDLKWNISLGLNLVHGSPQPSEISKDLVGISQEVPVGTNYESAQIIRVT